jgi:hypothetical protein
MWWCCHEAQPKYEEQKGCRPNGRRDHEFFEIDRDHSAQVRFFKLPREVLFGSMTSNPSIVWGRRSAPFDTNTTMLGCCNGIQKKALARLVRARMNRMVSNQIPVFRRSVIDRDQPASTGPASQDWGTLASIALKILDEQW